MRRPLLAGNWKMNKTVDEAVGLALALKAALADVADRDIMIAPPAVALSAVSAKIKGSPIGLAGQNMHSELEGAYTGEVSGAMLRSAGCEAVILGHSERRHIFGETDEMVNKKVHSALSQGLTPILCLGEKLDQREAGDTFKVLEQQLTEGLKGVRNEHATKVILAYEPVWAIGTGKTATPEQAQEVHAFLRGRLGEMYRSYVPGNLRILYGGSVKPSNVDDLMAQPDVDGALVGGASLTAEAFARIVRFQG